MYNKNTDDLSDLPGRGFGPLDYILDMAFDLKFILVFLSSDSRFY